MGWLIAGWLLAKALATMCALPGVGARWADKVGAAGRARLPWRLSVECSRALAEGAGRSLTLSWMAMALALAEGAAALTQSGSVAWALGSLSAGVAMPLWLLWARSSQRVAATRGQLWLSMVSSGELGASMGRRPAGPDAAWLVLPGREPVRRHGLGPGGRARRLRWHAGFVEMARRLALPFDGPGGPESVQTKRARTRLRAMMMACAGCELAARWLWRRRKSQSSMAQWARSMGEGAGDSGERWELSAAIMSVSAMASAQGSHPIEMDAAAATESSIPLLWASSAAPAHWLKGDSFDVGLRRECLLIHAGRNGAGSHESRRWGWRGEPEEGRKFKIRLVGSLSHSGEGWGGLLLVARQLLEAEELSSALIEHGAQPVAAPKAARRL